MKPPIDIQELDNLLVFRISGDLSSLLLDNLKHEIVTRVRDNTIHRVLINMDEVDYVTSKDLGLFVQIHHFLTREAMDHEKDAAILAFSNLKPFVKDIMDLTRLETVFRVFDTEDNAITELAN